MAFPVVDQTAVLGVCVSFEVFPLLFKIAHPSPQSATVMILLSFAQQLPKISNIILMNGLF